MQVTAGTLKGREFSSPPGFRAHPMSDRIKNALFNTLGDIEGLTVLDAFGGSGALAFEAISRSAKEAVICEMNRRVIDTIRRNIQSLGVQEAVKLKQMSIYTYANNADESFDLVLIDPPFDQWQEQEPEKLVKLLSPGGLMVISMPQNQPIASVKGLELLKRARYGKAALVFLRSSQTT